MLYTQIELTYKDISEVWWIPTPAILPKVGEVIERVAPTSQGDGYIGSQDWEITQVCVTLDEAILPPKARIAESFFKEPPPRLLMGM